MNVTGEQSIPPQCPKCKKVSRFTSTEDEAITCIYCGYTIYFQTDGTPTIEEEGKETRTPAKKIKESKKRLIPTDTKTSQERWRKSPAGIASIKRYRRSPLFAEAHARHRKTEKYKRTQHRFHENRKRASKLIAVLSCRCDVGWEYGDDGLFRCRICGKEQEV